MALLVNKKTEYPQKSNKNKVLLTLPLRHRREKKLVATLTPVVGDAVTFDAVGAAVALTQRALWPQ